MSAFSVLVLADPDIYDYYDFTELRGGGRFGPDFSSSAGGHDTMFRYGNDATDTYHVVSQVDFGYIYVNPGLDSGYFGGGEIDFADNSFTITSPGPWSVEAIMRLDDTTNITTVLGLSDFDTGNGFGLVHDPGVGFKLYTTSTTVPAATYANPVGTTFADGIFHHVVLTVNEPTIKLYVDNILAMSLSQALVLNGAFGSGLTIGFSYYLGFSYTAASGIWDEFAVYNRDLSAVDVNDHYLAAFPSGVVTNRLEVGADGYIAVATIPIHDLFPFYFRGGRASIDFAGDGQFEYWRGGSAPVLDLRQTSNKIDVYGDGWIMDPHPALEATATGIVRQTDTLEVMTDGWIVAETICYGDAIVLATNQRLYPRDSGSRIAGTVNRSYPLEP